MIGSILRGMARVKPSALVMRRTITTENGAIEKMPAGINKISPLTVSSIITPANCFSFVKLYTLRMTDDLLLPDQVHVFLCQLTVILILGTENFKQLTWHKSSNQIF